MKDNGIYKMKAYPDGNYYALRDMPIEKGKEQKKDVVCFLLSKGGNSIVSIEIPLCTVDRVCAVGKSCFILVQGQKYRVSRRTHMKLETACRIFGLTTKQVMANNIKRTEELTYSLNAVEHIPVLDDYPKRENDVKYRVTLELVSKADKDDYYILNLADVSGVWETNDGRYYLGIRVMQALRLGINNRKKALRIDFETYELFKKGILL